MRKKNSTLLHDYTQSIQIGENVHDKEQATVSSCKLWFTLQFKTVRN